MDRPVLSGRFFIPGPVEIDPAVAAAMQRPMIGHRTDEARELVARIQPGLQQLMGTTRPVMMATGSATAMMEAAIRSATENQVLCVVGGTFGERFARIAEKCGRDVIRLHVHRGSALLPEQLDAMMDGPPVDAITLVHSETSTGALAPIGALLERFRKRDILTIVDAVSSVGGMPVESDRWHADFVCSSSQKAIGTPPGLAFAVASERLLARAEEIDERGFYLDVVDLHQAAVESRFPQTPALPVVYALETQLERIADEGLAARFARHAAMRERVERWVARHGRCRIWAPAGQRSDTVTALLLRPEQSAVQIVRDLAAQGWQLATGLDGDEERVLRIAHMGDLLPEQLDPLLAAIESLL